MRIAFVTEWYPPEPAVIAENIARGLAELGHDVDVLTGFPNYPQGHTYPGWRQRPYVRELSLNGVTVHRTAVYPSHDDQPARRMATYLSYAATAWAAGLTRIPRPDVWLVYSSPATAALPALLARPGRRAPVCLLLQDLWPDSVTSSGMVSGIRGRLVERGLHAFVDASYRHASRIGVISPGMTHVLVARGVPPSKVSWTPNWLGLPEMLELPEPSGASPGGRHRRTFLYAGNLGALQDLHTLVGAFAQVPEADLVLLGHGVEADALRRRAEGLPNVTVLPQVTPAEAAAHQARADVLVVSLQDTPLLRVTMPSKVQAALGAGKPILAQAPGDVAALVSDNGAGVVAPPGDSRGTASTVRHLAQVPDDELVAMGHRSRQLYDATFSERVGPRRLETMLIAAREDSLT